MESNFKTTDAHQRLERALADYPAILSLDDLAAISGHKKSSLYVFSCSGKLPQPLPNLGTGKSKNLRFAKADYIDFVIENQQIKVISEDRTDSQQIKKRGRPSKATLMAAKSGGQNG